MQDKEKEVLNIADMLEGEINRMCVTDDIGELDRMALYAKANIERLRFLKREMMGENYSTKDL